MNTDIRLSVGFWRHPKTFRLEKSLGLRAIRSLQILWCWCAQYRPDGDLSGLGAEDIEFISDWRGKKGAFAEACENIGWLDQTEEGYVLHEWAEYNPYQAKGAEREAARKEKAQKAANARWSKPDANTDSSICSNDAQAYANDNASICSSNAQFDSSICSEDAPSNAQAMPSPTYTSTNIKSIKDNNPLTPLQEGVVVSEKADSPPDKSAGKKAQGNSKIALQAVMTQYTSNIDLLKALEDYRQMRERIRKPLTCKALEIGFRELDKLAADDARKIAIVEQSIFKSWQGFFPLPEQDGRASPARQELTLAEKNKQVADRVIAKCVRNRRLPPMDSLEKKVNALKGLAENFGKTFSDELMEMWLKLLAGFTAEQVELACLLVLTEYEFKTLPPFAVLKKALDKITGKMEPEVDLKIQAENEWTKLWQAICHLWDQPEDMHPATAYVLRSMGGWDSGKLWLEKNHDFKRREFIEMWIRIQENGEALGLPSKFAAIEQEPQSAAGILSGILPQRKIELCS